MAILEETAGVTDLTCVSGDIFNLVALILCPDWDIKTHVFYRGGEKTVCGS